VQVNGTMPYEHLLRLLASNAEFSDSYETLLGSLHLLRSSRPLSTLLVTSAQPEEGKTTVTTTLALYMALAGMKTVIVDCDLRKPRLHDMFELEAPAGFSDFLSGASGISEFVNDVALPGIHAGSPRSLGVITSGSPHAGSLTAFSSPRVKEAFARLGRDYEAVLVDSPPVLAASDSLLMAPNLDGVILVVSAGAVTEKDARRAKERLEQAGGRILGVVMNRFDSKVHGSRYHPYEDYYRKRV